MKLRIDTQELAQALGWAAKHLPARPPVPVLMGLRLDADDGRLRIEAFDYDTTARTHLDADIQQPGALLAPGRMLAAITNRLCGDQTQLTLDGGTLAVEAGAASFRLQTLPLADYPQTPQLPHPAGTIGGAELAAAITRVVVAAGRDNTVPALTSVRIRLTDSALDLAATDRYRAATTQATWQPIRPAKATRPGRKTARTTPDKAAGTGNTTNGTDPRNSNTVLVPWQTAADIAKTLAKPNSTGRGDGQLTLALSRDQTGRPAMLAVSTQDGNRELITRLLDLDFINLDKLMPTEFTCRTRIDTAAMLAAVRRLGAVAERNTPIRLDFTTPGQVGLEASSGDDVQGADTVPCDIDGQPLAIAFNPGYLADALTAVHATTAQFGFTSPTTAAVITPHENGNNGARQDQQGQASYRHLLMPVRLNS